MQKTNKPIIIWLLIGCFLVFLMVIVGGITRLKNAGLSMTDWKLFTDMLPPLSEESWIKAFEEYKKFPEYQVINKELGFSLGDYKFIYFWEWFHRLLGRLVGLVFIIPFLYFLIKKQFDKKTLINSLILLFMGGFQGFLGWYMVKSGLLKEPDVSHFRLAIHLTFAFITFAFTFWVALGLIYKNEPQPQFAFLKNLAIVAFILLVIQIIYGGFVAGLNAGLVHNTWPQMSNDQFIHSFMFSEKPSLLQNLTEGKSGVNFVHRTLAYFVVLIIGLLFYYGRKFAISTQQKTGINRLLILVFVQFALGVFTLLNFVPMWLGLLHQITAFFLLATMTYTLHRFSK